MKNLHELYEYYGSQQKMAEGIGVSQTTVSDWLSGVKAPSPRNAKRIHREFGIPREILRPEDYE